MRDAITLALAIWGSVLSTLLFAFKVMEMRRDRAAIWIRAVFGSRTTGPDTEERGLSVRIVNRGRRPAYVREVRVRLQGRTDIGIGEWLARSDRVSVGNDTLWLQTPHQDEVVKLEEGQEKHYARWVHLADMRLYVGARAEIVTTAGRLYYAPIIDLFEDHDLGHDTFV